MTPRISIIIPIYNSAPYLRECLDSVVNQTLRDIQIICVDRSSTDGSRQIIEEYAAKDPRFQIVECEDTPGGGPGQTRNAGLPHVRGKYLYFVDSDDWIAPTLCEKAFYRIESTGADIVFFFYQPVSESGQDDPPPHPEYWQWPAASSHANEFLDFPVPPWTRVVRTSFFRRLDVRFLEALLPEDLYFHWVLLTNEPQVELIMENLYYYRLHGTSITGQKSEYLAKDCQVISLIKKYLQSTGKYEQYRSSLLIRKFSVFHNYYNSVFQKNIRPVAVRWLRESMDDEEMDFLRNDQRLKLSSRHSILLLLGDKSLRWQLLQKMPRTCFNAVFKPIKMLSRSLKSFVVRKRIRIFQDRIQELSGQIAIRDKKIVLLQTDDNKSES